MLEPLAWLGLADWDSNLILSWRAPALTVCAEIESALYPPDEKNMTAQIKAAKVSKPTMIVSPPCSNLPILKVGGLAGILLLPRPGALLIFLAYSARAVY